MDHQSLTSKVKALGTDKRKLGMMGGLAMTGLIALAVGVRSAPHVANYAKHLGSSVFARYGAAFETVQEKVEELHHSEIENERLRLENAHLRLKLAEVQFGHGSDEAAAHTKKFEYKLDKETGSRVGRDLDSIAYHVPTQMVPGQVYTLGISYFKAREDEKAAVIFTFLTGLDDNPEYKTPKNFLMTGVAWYRLDNYALADGYFDRVLRAPETVENQPLQAHARLWKAMTAQRLGKHASSQHWLTELIDHHPHSTEAGWVNSEARRGVASED
jgi:hypothetical protein